jgi:hypothetical protein
MNVSLPHRLCNSLRIRVYVSSFFLKKKSMDLCSQGFVSMYRKKVRMKKGEERDRMYKGKNGTLRAKK